MFCHIYKVVYEHTKNLSLSDFLSLLTNTQKTPSAAGGGSFLLEKNSGAEAPEFFCGQIYRVRKNIRANRMLMIQVPTLISLILPVKIFTKT